jgi:predicted nuclease of predicted toxin-antitoxin system
MKFLIDAQLPPGLCRWLEARGHSADHVVALGLGTATDSDLALRAERDSAVLVSKDEDFLVLRHPARFQFLWLRCGNVTNPALAVWLAERWDQVEELLMRGEGLIELQ